MDFRVGHWRLYLAKTTNLWSYKQCGFVYYQMQRCHGITCNCRERRIAVLCLLCSFCFENIITVAPPSNSRLLFKWLSSMHFHCLEMKWCSRLKISIDKRLFHIKTIQEFWKILKGWIFCSGVIVYICCSFIDAWISVNISWQNTICDIQ